MPQVTNCPHKNIIPFQYEYGKWVYNTEKGPNYMGRYLDWSSNAINANAMRVTHFFCVDCQTILKPNITEMEVIPNGQNKH